MAIKWILNKNLGYDAHDDDGNVVGWVEHLSDNSWGVSIVCLPDEDGFRSEKLYTRGYLADEAKEVVELEWERRKSLPLYKDYFRRAWPL